jgi:hypothetical protein
MKLKMYNFGNVEREIGSVCLCGCERERERERKKEREREEREERRITKMSEKVLILFYFSWRE